MLEFHPLANLFPLIEGAAFDELVADIGRHGVLEPIVLWQGRILDGRNRYRAAFGALGLYVASREFDPESEGDPLSWVLSKNLHRRHLSESQRTLIAAELANLKPGRPAAAESQETPPVGGVSGAASMAIPEAAEMLNVSERSVQRGRQVVEHAAPEVVESVRRGDIAISAAAWLSELPEDEQVEILRTADARAISRIARERHLLAPNGARAIMDDRREPDDSLDYFPTPPWATRALIEQVLRPIGFGDLRDYFIWEPACGEGHIAGVLQEYGAIVHATDIFDYSVGDVHPPAWGGVQDFLAAEPTDDEIDWIITNPPFGEVSLAFVLKALGLARRGVAMFVRQQWLEGVGRYNALFGVTPPTIYAQFAERVPLHKGKWDPDGDTATAYCWVVWITGRDPWPVRWIPPGQRVICSRDDDRERFTAHPVTSLQILQTTPPVKSPEVREGSPDLSQLIRDGYGRNDPLEVIAVATGLGRKAIQKRAKRMGLTSPDRQRAAVAEANRRRGD